jgi:hypothetical protein
MKINKEKLTFIGSMNYIVQVWTSDYNSQYCLIDQYQPRKNRIWSGEIEKEEAKQQIEETIERMKIAIQHYQDFLDGKRDYVCYWELEKEPWKDE